MSIDIDTARKVAKLARIRVEEAHLPKLADQLSGILGFMEQLNEVNVDGVEPMVVAPKSSISVTCLWVIPPDTGTTVQPMRSAP